MLIQKCNKPCLSHSITAIWLVIIFRPVEARRLSGPGWLVTYRGDIQKYFFKQQQQYPISVVLENVSALCTVCNHWQMQWTATKRFCTVHCLQSLTNAMNRNKTFLHCALFAIIDKCNELQQNVSALCTVCNHWQMQWTATKRFCTVHCLQSLTNAMNRNKYRETNNNLPHRTSPYYPVGLRTTR